MSKITNLVVESEEPTWSINIKKAVASNLQLDVSGVRSGLDGGVFGERNAPALSSLEDGVTGDCFTTLRITRLPFYQVIQNHDLETHKIIGEICRSNKVFEIIKTKDFDQCRKDPLRMSSNPLSSAASSFSSYDRSSDGILQRFAAYKYLACGESSEKSTIVRMEGVGKLVFSGPIKLKTQQIVSLVIQSRGQIRNLLPSLSQPQVIDDLTFSYEEKSTVASAKEVEAVFEALQEVSQTLMVLTMSEVDISKKLRIISQIISRLDESQLREIWQKILQPENATTRDLFVDCTTASGSHTAIVFLLDLIERQELEGFQAVWTLMSSGHSMKHPKMSTLRRFVGIIRSEAARVSKLLKHTALMVSADLLFTSCVLSKANCNADAQIITEEFLPLLVHELETAQTEIDRLAAILALGALGVDDVLLLLVPYIRGEDVAARIAAIMSLKRLMDFSPDKVIPLLASLADNVAEHPEIRMAAISVLLFHKKTPLNIWKKIASRTWFDPSHQVAVFTCDIIQCVSSQTLSSDDESTSIKARSVIGLVRPCSGRSEFEHYASVKDNTAGLSSLLAFWRLRDSSMPVYLQHQLFRQLGSFRLDLAKVSIWNFNMESVWSQLLKHDDDILKSSEPNVFWDQLSLSFRTNDQPSVGLFHTRLFGSTMQTLFNLEDIDREHMIREFFTRHINIRFIKFQQLINIRTHVPTEIGLPARFTFSLTALASALGHIHQPEINVTASLSLKWTTESRIQWPFSGHHVAAGVENTAEIRAPIFLISNGSLVWTPPDRIYDLAYYNIKPYTLTSQTTDHSSETLELVKANHIFTKPPSVSVAQLNLNLRLETTSELPQEDPASAWLNSLMNEYSCDFGHFRLDGFQQRVYRLRYLPEEGLLSSVSLSASFNTETIQENADAQYILGVNGSMEWDEDGTNDTTSLFHMKDDSIHVYKGGITVHYGNGSMLSWAAVEMVAQSESEENEWNITASGSTIGSVRNWLNSKNIKYSQELSRDERSTISQEGHKNASEQYFQRIHFKIRESEVPFLRYASITSLFTAKSFRNAKSEKPPKNQCFIYSDRVVTYDRVEYNYTINECHHLLTANCGQKRAKYAIMGTNESHGMVVRITLEKDVIDVSSAGNISINGIEANFTANRMRIHMGERVVATATLNKDNAIYLRLPDEDLEIIVEKSTITLTAGEKLLGHACGMCGDGDSEVTGEFKTSNRCALSSGTLMAASFQINVGPENCPSMSDEILQALLMESFPCYSVDEQVASVLPLPLEF